MSLIHLLSESASSGHEAAGESAFPAFDPTWFASQLFWLAIIFTGLYIVLSRFILPRLSDTIEKRGDRIASDLDEAARLNDQGVEAQQALELRMTEAKAKARETANKARAKMDTEIAEETSRIDADIDARMADAEERLNSMRSQAMANVASIAEDAASSVVEKFGLSASASDLKQAVANSLSGKA